MSKNQQVPETNEVRTSNYCYDFSTLAHLSSVKLDVYCYRGIIAHASFMDTNPGEISKIAHHFSNIRPSRTLFQTVYYRSRFITSLEHIRYTDCWNGLWSALQSVLRSRYVIWRDGDWSTALLEGKSSFHNFRNLLIVVIETDVANCFFLLYF